MSRDGAGITTELSQDEIEVYNAVEIILDNSTLRFWTGYGKKAIGSAVAVDTVDIGDEYSIASVGTTDFTKMGATSNTVGEVFYATDRGTGTGTVNNIFTGAGQLMTIDGIAEASDLSQQIAKITFSGIPSDLVSLALSEPYQYRECKIYFGAGSESVEVFSGEMDTIDISDSADTSTMTLSVTSRLIKLNRVNLRRYTSENHKSRNSGDSFFSLVAEIQDSQIAWGRVL